MDGEVLCPFGCARVGNLGAFLKPDTGVHMMTMFGGQLDDFFTIRQQSLRHADPVAEIAGQFQAGISFQDGARGPGIAKVTQPMRFMSHGYAQLTFHFKGGAIEVLGFRQAPAIGTAMGVEEQRPVFQALLDLLPQ